MYCTVEDVWNTAGVDSSTADMDIVRKHILSAEADVDRETNTTWWVQEDTGTPSAVGDSSVTDSTKSWVVNAYQNNYVLIYAGTGEGQVRRIVSNTATVLTLDAAWTTNPTTGSTYHIIHAGSDPRKTDVFEVQDDYGTMGARVSWFAHKYPVRYVNSVTADDIDITPSTLYVYDDTGQIVLSANSEQTRWSAKPRGNEVEYAYGVYDSQLHGTVKELCTVLAAIKVLNTQMGGTHNIPSTISLPEASLTIGQAYINIKGTVDELRKTAEYLKTIIPRYTAVIA